MEFLISGSAICYYLMAAMAIRMQWKINKFNPNSSRFKIFSTAGLLAGIVYLILVGVSTVWYIPLLMLLVSLFLVPIVVFFTFLDNILSIVSVLGIPALIFLMFYLL